MQVFLTCFTAKTHNEVKPSWFPKRSCENVLNHVNFSSSGKTLLGLTMYLEKFLYGFRTCFFLAAAVSVQH